MARMKVLLTEDIPSLGLAGEVHTVARGYARNYLIPRREAIVATKGALKQAEEIRQMAIRRRAQEFSNAEAQAQVLSGQQLLFEVRAGDNDRLYGSITAGAIAERLGELADDAVDHRQVLLGQAIRTVGAQEVRVRLTRNVFATVSVTVAAEEPEPEEPAAEQPEEESEEAPPGPAVAETETAAADASDDADAETE